MTVTLHGGSMQLINYADFRSAPHGILTKNISLHVQVPIEAVS